MQHTFGFINQNAPFIPEEVTDIRFRNMILAMTRLCNDYLGTSVPVYGGEELAEEILREIIRPPYTMSVPAKNKWGERRCNRIEFPTHLHSEMRNTLLHAR